LSLLSALAGCGTSTSKLDTAGVERAIANSIRAERNIDATVSCPSGIPQQKGRVFTCMARLTVGTYPVSVTEVDGAGHVRYGNPASLSELDMAGVARAITISIRTQRRLAARVSCPAEVLQQKGLVFTCTATVRSRGYPFSVTEVDGAGHVRYVGH
jgi:ribosomal protein L13E